MKAPAILVAFILLAIPLTGCIKNENDKDGDGLPDKREIEGWDVRVYYPEEKNATVYHVTSNISAKDTDGDGLTDFEEFTYEGGATDPTKKDTDGDGLTDYEEKQIGTDPTNWQHDVDEDGFIDYEEIKYYKHHNVSHKKILQYVQDRDVDNDGYNDGMDMDPLRDLRINVTIEEIKVVSYLDGPDDGIIELAINISTGEAEKEFHETIIPLHPEILNFTASLDIMDAGLPGNISSPLMIVVKDRDTGSEKKLIDTKDGIPDYDFVRVFEGNEPVYAVNFNISKDCGEYHMGGVDGEIWFHIEDASRSV
ncbi:MAG: hypothetical protein J7L31_00325 [Thermoplasmata archaeon]|nr:hypothetical protein [Thermoplasmata archaeon]